MPRGMVLLLSGSLLAPLLPRGGAAQQISLTLSGAPNVFLAPTVTDYNNGFVYSPTAIGFTVDVLTGNQNTQRTTTVSIRATSATLGGGKLVADLQWRRADLVGWTPMAVSNAPIQSRPVKRNNLNDPWSNSVFFRIRLTWATDPPAIYSTGLVFTLTVTTP